MPVEDLYQALLDADRDADGNFSNQEIGTNVLPCGLTQHSLAVQLLEDGTPVANERYRLTLPDGEVRTGQLSAYGRIRVDHIACSGNCFISFPDIDAQGSGEGSGSTDNGNSRHDEIVYLPGVTQQAIETGGRYTYVLPDWDVVAILALTPEQADALALIPATVSDEDDEEEDDGDWDLVAIVAA